jgi:MFS transporter, DHA1 family, inner membrane transport protein
LLSAVLFAAMFATYTYLAVWLEHVAGFGGGAVGVALLSFGAAGFAGNWAAGRLADLHPTVATAVVAAVLAVMNAALPLAGSVSSLLPPVLAPGEPPTPRCSSFAKYV